MDSRDLNDWLNKDYGGGSRRISVEVDDDDVDDYAPTRNVLKINHAQRPEDIQVESLLQGPSYAPAKKFSYGGPVRGTSALDVLLERLERNERPSQQDVTQARREFIAMKESMADFEKKDRNVPEHWSNEAKSEIKQVLEKNKFLQSQIHHKEVLLADFQRRIEMLRKLPESMVVKGVTVEDYAPRDQVVDNFSDLYMIEWAAAFNHLKSTWADETNILATLFKIVKEAYKFSIGIAEDQNSTFFDLAAKMKDLMLRPSYAQPRTTLKYKPTGEHSLDTQKTLEQGSQLLDDFKSILCSQTIPGLQELFVNVVLPQLMASKNTPEQVTALAKRATQLTWLMAMHKPRLHLHWIEPSEKVVPKYFEFFNKKAGKRAFTTVWPAVLSQVGGDVLTKGVVLAGAQKEKLKF
ncbi:uncharacterized protein LOC127878437 [Dreissena polymorpha]|uniref:Mitochondria-eating protein C-terminal domain-containing protein n=1 Tax=Dreissena polymorpha TaxID=45954 RepID=A0A9D4K8T3_DREPO|nr:uncharacterized protein LOC127878437 [Dreissena polymorpha]KAH3834957.1 hypothetical protein DPMN_108291 [Dreissena polymorpha]